jgi:peptidoglycan/xylan/chitin deacetylase (PgdA/CDA1 family)
MTRASIVKWLSTGVDRVLPARPGVTVLIYHRVGGGSRSQVDLPLADFERQLDHLAQVGDVVSLDAALSRLAAPDDGQRSVVLTFDDGTADFTDHAVPALVARGLPATLYAATKFIDEDRAFPWDAPPTSWAALRDAIDTGLITVGSHTHSHWLMDRLDPMTVDADLDRSIELIEHHLGRRPQHFAYPKALPGSVQAEIAVRRRFASAALARSRVNRPGRTDVHRLWRTPIQRSDGFEFFQAKASGGLRLEGELRSAVSRLRYRGASR